jgi:hypothetical protein
MRDLRVRGEAADAETELLGEGLANCLPLRVVGDLVGACPSPALRSGVRGRVA